MRLRLFVLTALVPVMLSACPKYQPQPGPSDEEEVKGLVTHFITDLTVSGQRNMEVYSVPFWADGHWIETMEALKAEIPEGRESEFPGLDSIHLRIYPLAHLDVLFPSALRRLQRTKPPAGALDGVYVAAINLEIHKAGKSEQGWLLLRREEGRWKVAGEEPKVL